jgi:hypothetical protein
MQKFVRFGRRLAIPSTVEIRHELRSFSAQEDVREESAASEGLSAGATWGEIYAQRAAAKS